MHVSRFLVWLTVVLAVVETAYLAGAFRCSLTTSANPPGSGSISPSSGRYDRGIVVNLRATPSSRYQFNHWSGDASGTSPSITITMNSNKNIVANFSIIRYSLTTSESPSRSGSISPTSGTYDSGAVVTLTATPSSGYRFERWSGDASGTSPTTTVTMNSNKAIVANFVRIRYSLTVSVNLSGSGSVSPSSGTYDSDSGVNLTATPSSGYQFEGWSGDATGTSPFIRVTMNSNKAIVANFSRIYYNLTTSVSSSGGGSISPSSGTYDSGSIVTLTATPSSGYRFEGWSGDVSGTSPSIRVTMDSNKTIVANFTRIRYSLTISVSPSGSGRVSPSGDTYDSGAAITITAIPYWGYRFESWSGDASGTSPSIRVTMNSNKAIVANFVRVRYSLTTWGNPSGSGSVNPSRGTYDSGTVVTLTATPSSGYRFDRWSGDASGTSSSITITLDSNKTIVANFVRIRYSLTTSVSPSGSGSVSPGSGTYNSGTLVTLTATPSSGYRFSYWSGDASGTSPSIIIIMDSNKTIVANFSRP